MYTLSQILWMAAGGAVAGVGGVVGVEGGRALVSALGNVSLTDAGRNEVATRKALAAMDDANGRAAAQGMAQVPALLTELQGARADMAAMVQLGKQVQAQTPAPAPVADAAMEKRVGALEGQYAALRGEMTTEFAAVRRDVGALTEAVGGINGSLRDMLTEIRRKNAESDRAIDEARSSSASNGSNASKGAKAAGALPSDVEHGAESSEHSAKPGGKHGKHTTA